MKCGWFEDHYGWETGCGHRFEINDGTPFENDMRYCPFCGNPIDQHTADDLQEESSDE